MTDIVCPTTAWTSPAMRGHHCQNEKRRVMCKVTRTPCTLPDMTVTDYRVSERGQMALPAEARRRWQLSQGGSVEIADLGTALVIVPAGRGGLRSLLRSAIGDAGGYENLAADVASEEPELA